jgi:hypothetical protein
LTVNRTGSFKLSRRKGPLALISVEAAEARPRAAGADAHPELVEAPSLEAGPQLFARSDIVVDWQLT